MVLHEVLFSIRHCRAGCCRSCGGVQRHATCERARGARVFLFQVWSVNQVTASFRFTVEARACSVAARECVRLSTRVTAARTRIPEDTSIEPARFEPRRTCRDKIINPGATRHGPCTLRAPSRNIRGGVGVLTVLRRQMSIPSPRRPSLSERGAGHSRPSPTATARRLRATDSNVLQLVFIRRPAVPAERHSVGARVAPLPLWR